MKPSSITPFPPPQKPSQPQTPEPPSVPPTDPLKRPFADSDPVFASPAPVPSGS